MVLTRMSKITFRANDDLVERLEAFDASKSEVMREALREYLGGAERSSDAGSPHGVSSSGADPSDSSTETVDGALAERIDELVAERLDARSNGEAPPNATQSTPDVNVNVTLDGVSAEDPDARVTHGSETARGDGPDQDPRKTEPANASTPAPASAQPVPAKRTTCNSCGEAMDHDDVYCPNCGEKESHRVFCECSDEIRSDWSFCPSCGRRTPAANVLEGR